MTDDLAPLAEVFRAESCIVVGSAPLGWSDPELQVVSLTEAVVAVNGGLANCVAVDAWVLNARAGQDAEGHALYPLMVKQGAGRHVPWLVLFTWGGDGDPYAETLARLKKQGTSWDHVVEINNSVRRRIETAAGGRPPQWQDDSMMKHALSAGLAAACLCFWAGAATVQLEGFSWKPGYAYKTPRPVANRGHQHGDQVALARLAARYGPRLIHRLSVPDSLLTTAQQEFDMPARKPQPDADPAPHVKVRATKLVYYNHQRQRPGMVFTLRAPSHFKKCCMEDVAPDAVSQRPDPVAQQAEAQTIAQAVAGRRLKPNAVDLVPEPASAAAADVL